MARRTLTEVTPKPHEHRMQKVSEEDDTMLLVCTVEDCAHSKVITKPKPLKENKGGKRVLLG